jgi:hypothetical protein
MKRIFAMFILLSSLLPLAALAVEAGNVKSLTIVPPQNKKYDSPVICTDTRYGVISAFSDENRIILTKANKEMAEEPAPWPQKSIILESGNPDIYFSSPKICTDLNGGAYVAFADMPHYNMHIYKISDYGEVNPLPWPQAGITIESGIPDLPSPQICSDGMGGLIIAYVEKGLFDRIHLVKINAKGVMNPAPWPKNGVIVSSSEKAFFMPDICGTGSGGTVLVCVDRSDYDLHIFNIGPTGALNRSWPKGTISISSGDNSFSSPSICTTDNGSVIIAYTDTAYNDIHILDINAKGKINPLNWPDNGITIRAGGNKYLWPSLCKSGTNDAVIAFTDSPNYDIRLAKILGGGILAPYPGAMITIESGKDSFLAPSLAENSGRKTGNGTIVTYYDKDLGMIHLAKYLLDPVQTQIFTAPATNTQPQLQTPAPLPSTPEGTPAPIGKNNDNNQKAFVLKYGEGTIFNYSLSEDMEISIGIFEPSGMSIWHRNCLAGQIGGSKGPNSIDWDGRDSYGGYVTDGQYIFVIASGDKVLLQGNLLITPNK